MGSGIGNVNGCLKGFVSMPKGLALISFLSYPITTSTRLCAIVQLNCMFMSIRVDGCTAFNRAVPLFSSTVSTALLKWD